MIGCVKKKTVLLYDLLLTRIFKYYLRVKLDGRDNIQTTEFINVVNLTQSSLKISSNGPLQKIPQPMSTQQPLSLSSQPKSTTISDLGIFDAVVDIRKNCVEFKANIKGLQ